MHATRRLAVIGCLAWLATTALAARVDAAPKWLTPVDLSALGRDADAPQVAVDSTGRAFAVWDRSNGANLIVQAAIRPPGRNWQAPVNLSTAGRNADAPQIAVDPLGDAVAVWRRSNGVNSIIQAAIKPSRGRRWQRPVNLSAPGHDAASPGVAVDARGDAFAIWQRSNGANVIVQAAFKLAGHKWRAPVNLSAAGADAADEHITADSRGNAIAIWTRRNGAGTIIQAARKPVASARWRAPVNLSVPGALAFSIGIASDPRGDVIGVWRRSNGTNFIIQAAYRPTKSPRWRAPVDLSAPGQDASNPSVALDVHGNGFAIWRRNNGANFIVQSAIKPAGRSWQAAVDLSAAGQSVGVPQIGADARGDAVADWSRLNGSNTIIQGAVRSARSGRWRPPADLSAAGQNAGIAEIAVDPDGNAVAIWRRSNGANMIVQAAGYDGAGPLLGALSIPVRGAPGQPLRFSVKPLDVWSRVKATRWRFGDGHGSRGGRVTHVYASDGRHRLRLIVSDALGNATKISRTIVIAGGL
jgi:hypothetical protein